MLDQNVIRCKKNAFILFFDDLYNFSISVMTSYLIFMTVGYKIPTAEVLSGIDYMTTPFGLLREPDSANNYNREQTSSELLREPDSANNCNREQTSSELLREPDSANHYNRKRPLPGLLREPGSVLNNDCW